MRGAQQPRPMRQDLINIVQIPQFLRDALQSTQPVLVATLHQELLFLQGDQVTAFVPAGCL